MLTLPCFPELTDDEVERVCARCMPVTLLAPPRQPVRYSVVVPVYGNEATLPDCCSTGWRAWPTGSTGRMEAVFVVDGSPDGSLLVLRRLLPDGALRLASWSPTRGTSAPSPPSAPASRRPGATYVAAMAADLQEPPELVADVLRRGSPSGDYDVAVGTPDGPRRPAHDHGPVARLLGLYRRLVHRDIPAGGVDIFGCTPPGRERARRLWTSRTRAWSACSTGSASAGSRCPTPRSRREEGTSGWSLRRKLRYFLDSVFSFTDVPITLLTWSVRSAGCSRCSACSLRRSWRA